jgi:uncharacterized protein (DUF4415 family)
MSKKFTSANFQTDWARLDAMPDEEIDLSESPEITAEQMEQAVLRVGGKPVAREGKVQVNLWLDAAIIAYFQAQAGTQDYQALINDTLKATIGTKSLEALLRRIIREELAGGGPGVQTPG